MFESSDCPLTSGVALLAALAPAGDDVAMVDQLEALERLKSAAAAAQARITVALDDLRSAATRPPTDAAVGAEVGLARREGPHRGRTFLALGRALVRDLPATMAALARGDLNERRALLVVAQLRDVEPAVRRAVDADLAARPDTLVGLGDRRLQWEVLRSVLRHDPHGSEQRRERAVARRGVTGRRLPDGTGQVTAVLAEHHYAAVLQSLHAGAEAERAAGGAEGRSHTQLLADLFVARLTGQTTAQAVPVRLDLVVTAETLLGEDDEPGELPGHGPVPAGIARRLALASPAEDTAVRRVLRVDGTDTFAALESSRRTFTGPLREFVLMRDQVCRTPFCDSPVRHVDHVEAAERDGPTTAHNGQGLCVTCNQVKEQPGWRHATVDGAPPGAHAVDVTTPTGHEHRSHAPPAPRGQRRVEGWFEERPGHWVLSA